MKLTANRKSLLAALAIAAPVASANRDGVTMNVLLSPGLVEATSAELNVKLHYGCDCKDSGKALIPATLLKSMLSQMSDDEVTITADTKRVVVKDEHTEHKLPAIDDATFPQIGTPKWTAACTIPTRQFTALLKAIAPQADDIDSRFAIGSVLVEFDTNSLAVVARDGSTQGSAEIQAKPSALAHCLIPKRSCRALASFDADGDVRLTASENWFAVEFDGGAIMARLNEGRFPKWRTAAEKQLKDCSTEIVPSVLSALIRRVCVTPPDALLGPRAHLLISKERIKVQTAGQFESCGEIPCIAQGGTQIELNWRYLLDALRGVMALGDEPVKATSGEDGLILRRDGLTFVIMGMAN